MGGGLQALVERVWTAAMGDDAYRAGLLLVWGLAGILAQLWLGQASG
jgi:hypothetical protein